MTIVGDSNYKMVIVVLDRVFIFLLLERVCLRFVLYYQIGTTQSVMILVNLQ